MTKIRCEWVGDDPLYERYHDEEWGVPVRDDAGQFAFLTLETFQAGLSWLTILKKRANFQSAFDDFDYEKIASYGEAKVQALLQDSGIVRNRLKVRATLTNAHAFMAIQGEFGSFCNYIWGFVDHKPLVNHWKTLAEVPAKTALAEAISVDLKKRGFKFVGPTVVYAHMQATGMVQDHTTTCFRHAELS